MTGKQSLLFDKDVYVRCTATVVGKKEADGPLGEMKRVRDGIIPVYDLLPKNDERNKYCRL